MMGQKKSLVPDGDSRLSFHYQKTSNYRTIHVDGATLSSTPRGLFALSLFNERAVIPRVVRRAIVSQDDFNVTLGEEEVIESLEGVMRQVEATIMLDSRTLRDLFEIFKEAIDDGVLEENSIKDNENA
jgi:hypothetical protein